MNKRGLVKKILVIAVIVLAVLLVIFYNKTTKLNSENLGLKEERDALLAENGQLKDTKIALDKELGMLKDDIAGIYKTCMTQNACKGRYPNVRWNCNNVGDEASDPSHICICDASCNLNVTAI